jgi:hypothetical protein
MPSKIVLKFVRKSQHNAIVKFASVAGRLVVVVGVGVDIQVKKADELPGESSGPVPSYSSLLRQTHICRLRAADGNIGMLEFVKIELKNYRHFIQQSAVLV